MVKRTNFGTFPFCRGLPLSWSCVDALLSLTSFCMFTHLPANTKPKSLLCVRLQLTALWGQQILSVFSYKNLVGARMLEVGGANSTGSWKSWKDMTAGAQG